MSRIGCTCRALLLIVGETESRVGARDKFSGCRWGKRVGWVCNWENEYNRSVMILSSAFIRVDKFLRCRWGNRVGRFGQVATG